MKKNAMKSSAIKSNSIKSSAGFSLLEVLIALAVFSTAALAMLSFSTRIVAQHSLLEEKTLALWVAENTLEEFRMQRPWPAGGHQERWVENSERRWKVSIDVEDTVQAGLRRMVVEVRRENDPAPLAALTGYRGEY